MTSSSVLRRPALGQLAQIGTLYDARRDEFLSRSILSGSTADTVVVGSDVDQVHVSTSQNGSYAARAKLFDLEPGLAASYICGLAGAPGFLDYLADDEDGMGSTCRVLLCSYISKHSKLNLMHPDLRSDLDLAILQQEGSSATHIVTEVYWGSLLSIVASGGQRASSLNNGDKDLDLCFEQFQEILQNRGERITSIVPTSSYTFSIHGDDTLADFKTSDVNAIAQFLGDYAGNSLGKNTEPVTYALLPLSFLSLLFPLPSPAPLATPDKDCLERFIHVFDGLQAQRAKLNHYLSVLKGHRFCIPDSHIDAIAIAEGKATQSERLLRDRYSSLLVSVRTGNASMQQLWALLKEFEDGPLAPKQLFSAVGEFEAKTRFIDMVVSKGGQYAAFNHRRPWDFLGEQDTYVLFYYNDTAQQEPTSWQSHQSLMVDLLDRRRGGCTVVFCDCDVNGPSPRKIRISHIKDRRVVVNDMVDEEKFAADKSLVMCEATYFHRDERPKPQQRRAVRIPCPGQSCDSSVAHEWYCSRCRSAVEFGDQDQYLYCDCGYGKPKGYGFRCREVMTHGAMYERYKPKELLQLLQHLSPYREMNILILGETGVGKSTFINAFINYLTFETLDEAVADSDLQWIIPCSFSTQFLDEQGQFHQQDVKIGKSVEEADGSHGQSATQGTTVYRIQIGDLIVRLIDTPGIGDTRGIEQDKANMAGILSTLASFETLNGILILLKPNSARLTLMFKFCITELLTHLHRDASRNIVFGFTNTRITNYMPGDAFKPLQSLMNKYQQVKMTLHHANTYCFDSESFRYLAALKQTGRAMDNEDDFKRSWKRSEEESRRLLTHFQSLEPHLVKGTLSLNRARDLITKLTKPMAEIMDVINRTIRINEDHIQELNDERCKGDDLKKRMHFQKIDKLTKPLDKPRTVCTETNCVDFVQGVDKKVINYRTHCHKVCYLTEVPKEIVGDNKLAGCAAFAGGKGYCRTPSCGHKWQSHMHVWYELEDKLITEKNSELEAMLKKNESEIEVKKSAIQVHERKIKEAKAELKELEDAAARFGLFLKMNSITPYNDEMLAYLDEQIKEEKQIVNSTRTSQDRLNGLLRTRKEYEQQIRILEKEMDAGGSKRPLDERDVEKLVLKLYSLKGWGQSLKDIKTAAEYYGGATYNERHFRAHRTWRTGNTGGGGWSSTSMSYRAAGGPNSVSSFMSGQAFNQGHYSHEPAPQKYSSLIPPDDDTGSLSTTASLRTRSMVPSLSGVSLQSGGIREVEPSLSSRLKSGIFARLKKSSRYL